MNIHVPDYVFNTSSGEKQKLYLMPVTTLHFFFQKRKLKLRFQVSLEMCTGKSN